MGLVLKKRFEDPRGKILMFSFGNLNINLVEIKKGYARAGHFHNYESKQFFVEGRIEFRAEDVHQKKERIEIINFPKMVKIPSETAHLFIALWDSLLIEVYEGKFEAIDYPKYRDVVKKTLSSKP